jgi:hypothetical protein
VTDPREPLGRLVHDIRLACEADRAAAEGRERFNLPPWEKRDDWQRELDMRIGSAVAARAVADAGLEAVAMRKQLVAFSIHMPALRRALAVAIAESDYEAEAGPYRAALRVLGGEDAQERTDGKEAGRG